MEVTAEKVSNYLFIYSDRSCKTKYYLLKIYWRLVLPKILYRVTNKNYKKPISSHKYELKMSFYSLSFLSVETKHSPI